MFFSANRGSIIPNVTLYAAAVGFSTRRSRATEGTDDCRRSKGAKGEKPSAVHQLVHRREPHTLLQPHRPCCHRLGHTRPFLLAGYLDRQEHLFLFAPLADLAQTWALVLHQPIPERPIRPQLERSRSEPSQGTGRAHADRRRDGCPLAGDAVEVGEGACAMEDIVALGVEVALGEGCKVVGAPGRALVEEEEGAQ
eukprot:747943-Hanusia_phi.AAC.2